MSDPEDDALTRLEQEDAVHTALLALARDETLDGVDLLPGVRAALAAPRARTRSLRLLAAPALLAAAAALVAVVTREGTDADDGFRARGASADAASFAGVRVLRETEGGGLVAVERTLHASDGLAFTYANGGPRPFTHLMIFSVAPDGDVLWYWPAFVDPASDPTAVPLQSTGAGGLDVELRTVVRQALRPGPLTLHAVFLRAPVAVSEVERAVQAGATPPFLPGATDAHWQTMALEVLP